MAGKVLAGCTVSLDGFLAGPDDDVSHLFTWYGSGDTEVAYPDGHMVAKVSAASADVLRQSMRDMGALVIGRRTFDITDGWSGRHPFDVPVFVVTHSVPREWVERHEGAPFTFITDGVERAIAQAREAAGDKNVGIGMSSVTRQALRAGLVDEVGIDLAPVILGAGIRLFDRLEIDPIRLERTATIEGTGVTHLRFRVVRELA